VKNPLLARSLLDRIPNKREFLARSFRSLGVLQMLEQISRLRPASMLILTYHRIATPGVQDNLYYDPVISATPAAFETQIALLASRYRVVSLDELDHLNTVPLRRWGRPSVLVTFDDGYRDNFEVALPILLRHGVPATFFIPTSYLETPRVPWWDHVAYVIKQTRHASFAVRRSSNDAEPIDINLGENPADIERTCAITTIIDAFLEGAIPDEAWFLKELEEQAHVSCDGTLLGRELFMGWEELVQISRAGMSIGSHGHSHRALGSLDEAAQREELGTSKCLLESNVGQEVRAIAYPYGWHGSFTAVTRELAREAGYRWGFSSLEGINPNAELDREPLALRRLNIGSGDSPLLLRARLGLYASVGGSFL
jgi:peptidoglycan/xylan/chitin deacetylase (PgdA/CDA1 family)